MSRKLLRILVLAVVLIAPVVFGLYTWGPGLRHRGQMDFAQAKAFGSVVPGMTEAQAIEILGEPDDESKLFDLTGYDCPEEMYARAERGNADRHLYWYAKPNALLVLCINERGGVVGKLVATAAEDDPEAVE